MVAVRLQPTVERLGIVPASPSDASRGAHSHAVEERPSASGVGVGVAGSARLPEDLRGQERQRRGQIDAALQEVVHPR